MNYDGIEQVIKMVIDDPATILLIIVFGPIFYFAAKANERGKK